MVKYSNPEEQQLKKHERLQFLTKNDFVPETGEYVERKKVNGDSWRLQITTARVKDFRWLASRAKRKLSYLKLDGVQVDSWEGLHQMTELRVLDLEKMDLSEGLPEEIETLVEMRALIVMSCQLSKLEHIENFKHLNTLIIGKNQLTSLPRCISTFTELEKISFSSNDLIAETIPNLSACTMLKQVRFSHNPRLTTLPEHFERWTKADGVESKLECLYLSSTGINDEYTLDRIFEHSNSLLELAISNTPLIEGHESLYEERCKAALPSLKIYNGTRFDPNYVAKVIEKVKRDEGNTKSIRSARKEERKHAKIHAAEVRGAEIRLLKAGTEPSPKLEKVLTLEETEALAAKKAAKKERKKERVEERLQMRRKARIMAGLDPDPPPPPPGRHKKVMPSKAERKAWKQLKNEERFERRKKRFAEKAQRKREKALMALDGQPGTRIEPQSNGQDVLMANRDFIAFDDEAITIVEKPRPEPEELTTQERIKRLEKQIKKQKEGLAADKQEHHTDNPARDLTQEIRQKRKRLRAEADAEAPAVEASEEVKPEKKRKKDREAAQRDAVIEAVAQNEAAFQQAASAITRKRKHRADKHGPSAAAVTAESAHDALGSKPRKEKKPRSIGGSLAAEPDSAPPPVADSNGINGHSSVVSVTEVRKSKKKRKSEDVDLTGVLGDRMEAVEQW